MTDVHREIARLAAAQDDLVAHWQLRALELHHNAIAAAMAGKERLFDGVAKVNFAPVTQRQRLRAASLSAPDTALAAASAADHLGIRANDAAFEVVVRPGAGGKQRLGDLLVCRSTCLEGHVATHAGIPTTTADRTLLDLAPHVGPKALAYALLQAVRLELVTWETLRFTLAAHRGRRGVARLRVLVDELVPLPIAGNESLSESLAVLILSRHGIDVGRTNEPVAGHEADLIFDDRRLIVEIDGGPYHHPVLDAIKDAAWRACGWTVERVDSDDVWNRPRALVAAVSIHPVLAAPDAMDVQRGRTAALG